MCPTNVNFFCISGLNLIKYINIIREEDIIFNNAERRDENQTPCSTQPSFDHGWAALPRPTNRKYQFEAECGDYQFAGMYTTRTANMSYNFPNRKISDMRCVRESESGIDEF